MSFVQVCPCLFPRLRLLWGKKKNLQKKRKRKSPSTALSERNIYRSLVQMKMRSLWGKTQTLFWPYIKTPIVWICLDLHRPLLNCFKRKYHFQAKLSVGMNNFPDFEWIFSRRKSGPSCLTKSQLGLWAWKQDTFGCFNLQWIANRGCWCHAVQNKIKQYV